MTKKTLLYDHSGCPIRQISSGDQSMSVEVQALVETRIESAINHIKEHNKYDLDKLADSYSKKWKYISLITTLFSFILGLVTWFYAPGEIKELITTQVDEKMTIPTLKESADRILQTKMSDYIEQKLKPLIAEYDSLRNSIEKIRNDIETKQVILKNEQISLSEKIKIQELSIESKAGIRSSYDKLIKMQNGQNQQDSSINFFIKEIELFFDVDRGQVWYPRLVLTESKKNPGFSVEEIIYIAKKYHQLSESAVNTLSEMKYKKSVKTLCELIEKTDDLRVASRATRALYIITGEDFKPLEFDKVSKWWRENKDNELYNGEYDEYIYVVDNMDMSKQYEYIYNDITNENSNEHKLESLITKLNNTINSDNHALHAYCLKASLLMRLEKFDEAKQVLNDARGKQSDYYWLYYFDAQISINEKKYENAIELINKFFNKSPRVEVEDSIKKSIFFGPIVNSNKINWPSKNRAAQ